MTVIGLLGLESLLLEAVGLLELSVFPGSAARGGHLAACLLVDKQLVGCFARVRHYRFTDVSVVDVHTFFVRKIVMRKKKVNKGAKK